jgi:hypothetical protein
VRGLAGIFGPEDLKKIERENALRPLSVIRHRNSGQNSTLHGVVFHKFCFAPPWGRPVSRNHRRRVSLHSRNIPEPTTMAEPMRSIGEGMSPHTRKPRQIAHTSEK